MPFFAKHREELTTLKHIMILKIDWNKYRNLEKNGIMFSLVLRNENSVIVGYSVILVMPNMHFSDLIQAYSDTIYVHPKHRNTTWGIKLIKQTEKLAKEKGAKLMLWHGREGSVFSSIMPRLGYYVQDILFGKEL
jgi:GNAT superfamily N-acetyltransferase